MSLSVQYNDDCVQDDAPLLGTSDIEELDDDNQIQKTNVLFTSNQLPVDRFNFVFWTFNLLGISTLLPFTFFMTASDYWMYKFRNVSDVYPPTNFEDKTHLQARFQGYFALTANVAGLIMFICNTCLIKRFSQEMRNSLSLIAIILFFGATLTFIKLNTDLWQMGFFELTMITVVIINGAAALYQGGLVGLASIFPPAIMHSLVYGQGLAGVLPAVAQILSLLGGTHPTTSALIYFSFGIAVLILAFICFIAMHKTNYFKFYIIKSQVCHQLEPVITSSFSLDMSNTFALLWPYITALFVTSFITFVLFPGIVTLAVSVEANPKNQWTSRYFLPVACFLVFSVADISGRVISGCISLLCTGRFSVLIVSCGRVVFIPLFMVCNLHPRARLPVIFSNDAYYIAFMALFGLTNGYSFSQAMVLGTKGAPARWRNDASVLLSLAVGLGLLLGSVSSVGLIKVL